jgi:hypothetical protein
MKLKILMLGYLAAGLLVGAPQAMAQSFGGSLVVGVDSASGKVDVVAEICMAAVSELIEDDYVLQSSSSLGGSGGPDLSTYLFTGRTNRFGPDVVTLYCIADIDIGDDDDDGPGGEDEPDGMDIGMCGGVGMGC